MKMPGICILLLLIYSCSEKKANLSNGFVFPDIEDTTETATYYFSPAYLTTPSNRIGTIEKIGNKANLQDRKTDYECFIDDYHHYDNSNKSVVIRTGLTIIVDTTREVSIDRYEWGVPPPLLYYYHPEDENNPKTKTQRLIDSISFAVRQQAWAENKSFVKGFPVYVVNNSRQPVRVEEQDVRLMIIQEALDKAGQWRPIEAWHFSDCGNSYGGIALRPGYYIMTKVIKYKGAFETMLRLKMANDSVIYYSQPFRGSINLTQMLDSTNEDNFRPEEFFIKDWKKR